MSPVLCQSATLPMRLNLACQNNASEVLYGVYLCGTHGHAWRARLKAGEKIRLHPRRIWSHQGLPLNVDGPALPPLSEPDANVAEPTGSAVPAAAYAGPADSGVSATTAAPHLCETCGTRPVHHSNHEVRSRWCLECQIDGSVPLPKHRYDDGPATELMPPTYCFRSFCICCGRGREFITRERKPVQGATRCAHCGGRMIVEFT